MRKIFATIRRMLAGVAVADLFNSVAHDIIKNHILPGLREEDADSKLIEMYERYSNPRNSVASKYGNDISKNVATVLRARGFTSEDDVQDASQQIITKIYEKKKWKRFHPETGPVGLFKFLLYMARQDSLAYVKKRLRHREREIQLTQTHGEDDNEFEEREMAKAIDEPENFLRDVMDRDTLRDLGKFMRGHLKKDWQRELFTEWMRVVASGSRINLNRDLAEPVADKFGISFSTVTDKIQQFKKLMARFFKTQYDFAPLRASERVAGLGLIDRVVYAEYRRRLSDWVLPSSPLCRRVLLR